MKYSSVEIIHRKLWIMFLNFRTNEPYVVRGPRLLIMILLMFSLLILKANADVLKF